MDILPHYIVCPYETARLSTPSCELFHSPRIGRGRVQRALIPPPRFVQTRRDTAEGEQRAQIREIESLGLEDALQEWDVDER